MSPSSRPPRPHARRRCCKGVTPLPTWTASRGWWPGRRAGAVVQFPGAVGHRTAGRGRTGPGMMGRLSLVRRGRRRERLLPALTPTKSTSAPRGSSDRDQGPTPPRPDRAIMVIETGRALRCWRRGSPRGRDWHGWRSGCRLLASSSASAPPESREPHETSTSSWCRWPSSLSCSCCGPPDGPRRPRALRVMRGDLPFQALPSPRPSSPWRWRPAQ
jgi:hypothetical protein